MKTQINLQSYKRIIKERGFQPPWYKVAIYECAQGHEVRIRMHGNGMPPGAIYCPQCENANEKE